MPLVAGSIAIRLLSSGQEESLKALYRANTRGWTDVPVEWQLARLKTLDALGRADEAQTDRRMWFQQL